MKSINAASPVFPDRECRTTDRLILGSFFYDLETDKKTLLCFIIPDSAQKRNKRFAPKPAVSTLDICRMDKYSFL